MPHSEPPCRRRSCRSSLWRLTPTGANLVATGAVLGSPFLLLTLGAGATGVAVVIRGGARRLVDRPIARRAATSACSSARSRLRCCRALLPSGARIAVGAILLLAYAVYVVATLRGSGAAGESPEPLHIVRWRPRRAAPGARHGTTCHRDRPAGARLATLRRRARPDGVGPAGPRASCSRSSSSRSRPSSPKRSTACSGFAPTTTCSPSATSPARPPFSRACWPAIGVVFTTWQPGSAGSSARR